VLQLFCRVITIGIEHYLQRSMQHALCHRLQQSVDTLTLDLQEQQRRHQLLPQAGTAQEIGKRMEVWFFLYMDNRYFCVSKH